MEEALPEPRWRWLSLGAPFIVPLPTGGSHTGNQQQRQKHVDS
jgi:hypothetical protein